MPQKILIVDDEQETSRMYSLGLQMLGYDADYALSGAQALAKIETNRPDAVVLDLMMPDTDGFEVTRQIRSNPATQAIKIIIVSAIAQPEAEENCLLLGADAFMPKPVGVRELAEKIKQVSG